MKLRFLFFLAIGLLLASPAAAQVDISITDSVDATSTTSITTDIAVSADLSDEGLGDDDLEQDLAAEALPTTNRFSYFFERIRDQVTTTFTFNAERKAERYRIRLHNLDRKLTACAEIGDSACGDKIGDRIAVLTDRAEQHIAKKQELADQWEERFAAWRAEREARIQVLRDQALERKGQRQQLIEARQTERQAAQANRRVQREEAQQLRQQNRTDRQQLRQDARTDRQQTRQQNQADRAADREAAQVERQEIRQQSAAERAADRHDAANERIQLRTQDNVP